MAEKEYIITLVRSAQGGDSASFAELAGTAQVLPNCTTCTTKRSLPSSVRLYETVRTQRTSCSSPF